MTIINMVQTGKNRWKLETVKGIILLDDILAYSLEEAKTFAKAYVSTWKDWDFNLIPRGKK